MAVTGKSPRAGPSQADVDIDISIDLALSLERALAKAPGPEFKSVESRTPDALKAFGEEFIRQLLTIYYVIHDGNATYKLHELIDEIVYWLSPNNAKIRQKFINDIVNGMREKGAVEPINELADKLCTAMHDAAEDYHYLSSDEREARYGNAETFLNPWDGMSIEMEKLLTAAKGDPKQILR